MLRGCQSGFSLEECRSRFLFGITTVIRQLTSSPRAETHGEHVSYNDNTVPPCPFFTAETLAVSLKPVQTSSAAGRHTLQTGRKFV